MRDAGTATGHLPEVGERMGGREGAIDVGAVASRVVALAHLAAAMHMHGACAESDMDTPSNREVGS